MDITPVPSLIFVAILAACAYAIYRIGKRSTACGVTLGIGLLILLVIVAIFSTQVTFTITGR